MSVAPSSSGRLVPRPLPVPKAASLRSPSPRTQPLQLKHVRWPTSKQEYASMCRQWRRCVRCMEDASSEAVPAEGAQESASASAPSPTPTTSGASDEVRWLPDTGCVTNVIHSVVVVSGLPPGCRKMNRLLGWCQDVSCSAAHAHNAILRIAPPSVHKGVYMPTALRTCAGWFRRCRQSCWPGRTYDRM